MESRARYDASGKTFKPISLLAASAPSITTWLSALIMASTIRFLPGEVNALDFVPFCGFVGGVSGAFWGTLTRQTQQFPTRESFRGVAMGTLFGLLFVVIGATGVER